MCFQLSESVGLSGAAEESSAEDNDVTSERQRLIEIGLEELKHQESIVIQGLEKYYGQFHAVKKISLGVKKGECFGLLGVNGAGKTTTFKMLTGDESISSGMAYLEGHSVTNEIKTVQNYILKK